MQLPRSSGILLHPTSLPGPFGIGSIGSEARRFIDLLAAAGQRFWQILPLTPTGFGNSPYMSISAFAGNPLLVDPEALVERRLLSPDDLAPDELKTTAGWHHPQVNFEEAVAYKTRLLETACENFLADNEADKKLFDAFCEQQGWWLDDYALFAALKEANDDLPWQRWDTELARREEPVLDEHSKELQERVFYYKFAQYLFEEQWSALKRYANAKGVSILGDLPIYVSADSADVWAHPHLFQLGEDGHPTVVAGVPPDYFSATGQLWGNPIYDWQAMEKDGYIWWARRLRRMLDMVDLVRIDHFRGFAAYWEVPATQTTAIGGQWVKGPGNRLFDAIEARLGSLPVVAEDLGVQAPEVDALRDHYGLSGMKVLQFAFDGVANNLHLPHNHVRNALIYTGTHDNNTTVGWYNSSPEWVHRATERYLNLNTGWEIHWALIRAALASVGHVAIIPLQDILGLDELARMNTPGTAEKNWAWRCLSLEAIEPWMRERLADLTALYGRWPA
ncbi:4-alpha-glucanotransferase [Gloeobacter kilaueensis]|uniref:4-alpha-glucanotransferase n=1 Tax=Gloeobacter kilaueensis (strain ATCC BAA-2537 / CCAP 1431/1 / ULC 316 / JS1) TaxID=1183438 RepID=U5QG85_GLOK1|nr:4-alpha-glucanotransferase [Gloeobacter kilaueensis]AGY57931.1 4-alpha-glucanotransferase [Gloeobacter kilaueensis JS1]